MFEHNLRKVFDYTAMNYDKLLLVEQTDPITVISFVYLIDRMTRSIVYISASVKYREKEIGRMTLEHKLKQPQTLFAVWARKSLTNQNPAQDSSPTTQSIDIEIDSTTKIDDTHTSPASSSSLPNKLSKRSNINYILQ